MNSKIKIYVTRLCVMPDHLPNFAKPFVIWSNWSKFRSRTFLEACFIRKTDLTVYEAGSIRTKYSMLIWLQLSPWLSGAIWADLLQIFMIFTLNFAVEGYYIIRNVLLKYFLVFWYWIYCIEYFILNISLTSERTCSYEKLNIYN